TSSSERPLRTSKPTNSKAVGGTQPTALPSSPPRPLPLPPVPSRGIRQGYRTGCSPSSAATLPRLRGRPSDRRTLARLRADGCDFRATLVAKKESLQLRAAVVIPSNTGVRVQSYACIKTADDAYEIVTCNICRGVHLIDRASGRMLSEDEDAKVSEMAK